MARGGVGAADFAFDSVTLEAEVNTVTLNFDVPTGDITSFSDAYQNVVAGKPAATIDIAGSWNGAAGAGDVTIFGELGSAAKAWDFEPAGATGYDGYAVVTSYSITASVTDAVKYTASFQHNGASAAIAGTAPSRA